MTEPVMTLQNGDTIRVGEYGVTRDGRKVGPMIEYTWSDKRDDVAFVEEHGTGRYWSISGVYRRGENRAVDIIAKWNPVEAGADPVTPNYYDFNWHGWNGGECPVHPETVVDVLLRDGRTPGNHKAGNWVWGDQKHATIVAFRVITPYAEPAPAPAKPAKRDLRTIDDHELFGELDERTQKRLRKAAKRGWPVQWFDGLSWEEGKPSFRPDDTYRLDPAFTPPAKRVKPAPVVETITQEMWQDVHGKLWNYARLVSTPVTVTHTRTNGEIDNDSYKVEG